MTQSPASPAAGDGRLRLTVQSSLIGRPRFGVRARVDGEPVPVQHGSNVIALPAGRHQVEVFMVLVREYGNATAQVEVPAHGEAALWYAPPFEYYVSGRIGPEPQRAAGTWFFVLVAVFLVLGIAYTVLR